MDHISDAIFASMAAPMKKVFGLSLAFANAEWIRRKAVPAVFQCSSAPAGSMPPFNSVNVVWRRFGLCNRVLLILHGTRPSL